MLASQLVAVDSATLSTCTLCLDIRGPLCISGRKRDISVIMSERVHSTCNDVKSRQLLGIESSHPDLS